MGDPALADPAKIPDHGPAHVLDPQWKAVIGGCERTAARYIFLHDNLLDLSHLPYLHSGTIGGAGVAATQPEIRDTEGRLELVRYVKSDAIEHLPIARTLGIKGLVDRTMPQWFFPPSFHVTGSDFVSAEKGGSEPGRVYGRFRVLHALTPETLTTTHYFWAFCRNFRVDEDMVGEGMKAFITSAVTEDKAGTAACEEMLKYGAPPTPEIHARADGAGIQGRRMIEQLIEKERGAMERKA